MKFHKAFKESFIKFHKVRASFTKFQKNVNPKLLKISYEIGIFKIKPKFICVYNQGSTIEVCDEDNVNSFDSVFSSVVWRGLPIWNLKIV